MPFSKARYSAAVSAIRGVAIRSTAGSFARFMNMTVRSMAPVRWKSEMKEVGFLKSNTDGCGYNGKVLSCIPAPLPDGRSVRPDLHGADRIRRKSEASVHEPACSVRRWRIHRSDELGRVVTGCRVHGQAVDISHFVRMISGPPSMGRPIPSKTRPSISGDTASSMPWPRKRTLLFQRLMPAEFSNSCTSTLLPLTSRTRQWRMSPLGSSISPSSSYPTPSTLHQHQRAGNFGYGLIFFSSLFLLLPDQLMKGIL